MSRSRILVAIPCLNEERYIESILETLLKQLATDSLIVVADGGSTDRTRALVARLAQKDARVMLLDNPARLQSAGVNAVASMFGSDFTWMVRADAHAEYPTDFVPTLISEAEATGADSVVTAMVTKGTSCFTRAAAAIQNSRLGTGGARHRREGRGGWIEHGHHSLFRLEAFLGVDGYDRGFSHNEDAELDLRLIRSGARIWLTAKTWVVYHPRRDVLSLARQYRNHGAGRARTLRKHRLRPRPRQLAPALVAPAALLACLAPWQPIFAVPLGGWAALCLAGGVALAARMRSACVLASGLIAMVMHAAWSVGFWSATWERRTLQ